MAGPYPLTNYGNTCYFNSLLQAVRASPVFVKYAQRMVRPAVGNRSKSELSRAFMALLERPSNRKLKAILELLDSGTTLRMSEQHDVHDLYLVILDALLECSPNKSWVDVVLGVELTAETKCVECGHASRVPAKSPYFRVDIADSFDTTVKPKIEYMTAQGARYRCSFCRVQQPARRLETITDIPRMLVVQLMRLRFDGAKNFDTVSIPEDFLLEPYLRFPWILRSVILHAGDRSQGHYVALVKVGNQWWLTNDEELNKVSVAELDLYLGESQTNTELSQMLCPYLLFYEREDQVS